MNFSTNSHRRKNILTGEWVLVSPHRNKRPWQGKMDQPPPMSKQSYDPNCYLCPSNIRSSGALNPAYEDTFVFTNDFAALVPAKQESYTDGLLQAKSESGECKVICYSPNHSLTLPLLHTDAIEKIIQLWIAQYRELGSKKEVNYVQIFENKGELMGCSNPHPHGQIWAQHSIPQEVEKKDRHLKAYWNDHSTSIISSYIDQELKVNERIVLENDSFLVVVPFWAVWPYETMIIPKSHQQSIDQMSSKQQKDFAAILKAVTIKYDNLFQTSFPYSAGIHQAPTNDKDQSHWHWHMCFYPPLLRSADIKKFMVGYELFANPQRDSTAEQAAEQLRACSLTHYSL